MMQTSSPPCLGRRWAERASTTPSSPSCFRQGSTEQNLEQRKAAAHAHAVPPIRSWIDRLITDAGGAALAAAPATYPEIPAQPALALGLTIPTGDLMRYFRTCSRILTYPLLALFLFTTVPLVPPQAALIGTDDVLQQRDLPAAREKVALP